MTLNPRVSVETSHNISGSPMRTSDSFQSNLPHSVSKPVANTGVFEGVTSVVLVDCGRASEVTCGGIRGFFEENAPPPFIYFPA
jgi:hypothetical protein